MEGDNTEKKVTMQDIAEELGVAASTVSRAFSGSGSSELREQVHYTAERLGYKHKHQQRVERSRVAFFPSDGLVLTNLHRDILALLPEEGTMRGRYFPDALDAKAIARQLGDPMVNANLIVTHLKMLHKEDYVALTSAPNSRHSALWQRTEKGRKEASTFVPRLK